MVSTRCRDVLNSRAGAATASSGPCRTPPPPPATATARASTCPAAGAPRPPPRPSPPPPRPPGPTRPSSTGGETSSRCTSPVNAARSGRAHVLQARQPAPHRRHRPPGRRADPQAARPLARATSAAPMASAWSSQGVPASRLADAHASPGTPPACTGSAAARLATFPPASSSAVTSAFSSTTRPSARRSSTAAPPSRARPAPPPHTAACRLAIPQLPLNQIPFRRYRQHWCHTSCTTRRPSRRERNDRGRALPLTGHPHPTAATLPWANPAQRAAAVPAIDDAGNPNRPHSGLASGSLPVGPEPRGIYVREDPGSAPFEMPSDGPERLSLPDTCPDRGSGWSFRSSSRYGRRSVKPLASVPASSSCLLTAHPPGSLALRATAGASALGWLIWALCVTLASDSPRAQGRSGRLNALRYRPGQMSSARYVHLVSEARRRSCSVSGAPVGWLVLMAAPGVVADVVETP